MSDYIRECFKISNLSFKIQLKFQISNCKLTLPVSLKNDFKYQVLDESFFNRDTLTVAKDLLGKYIVRRQFGRERSLKITEVEAYDGHEDQASHARFGRTARSEVMFFPAGYFYIYLVYGMHWMINVVTREVNYPAAILLRATSKVQGPAKIAKYLSVDDSFNKKKAEPESNLWFEDRGVIVPVAQIRQDKRIGVDYAGPEWAGKLYRFRLLPRTEIELTELNLDDK